MFCPEGGGKRLPDISPKGGAKAMIRYDVNGVHFAEMFAPSLSDLLPGVMPTEEDVGEGGWDEELAQGYEQRVGRA